MKGSYDNSQPIFRQIIERILLSIATGELPPGGKVAPVREMALEHKVNPNTMQKSLAKLEEMGYLFTERTSGRYVTKDLNLVESLKTMLPAQITEKYVSDMSECGITPEDIPYHLEKYLERRKGKNG
ncbi:MAG: GntR family transcriptional regulator [Defluviitaleaceae bacterium]|nr:GntR family transcriptional regulator [Defluviitaleaceae bacterium]